MKKKLVRFLAIACSALCLCGSATVAPAATITAQAAMPETSETQNEVISWVYLKSEGKLYRRLFNYSTGQWIGNWIYVRDLKPGEFE